MPDLKQLGVCFSENFLSVVETDKGIPTTSFQMPVSLTNVVATDSFIASLSDSLAFADLLQKNIVNHGIFTKDVYLALPSRDVIIRWFVIPMMKPSEVPMAITFEVKKYLPFSMEELVYHYSVSPIAQKGSSQLNVFFVAIRKTTFEAYVNLFSQVGLTVRYSEPSSVSLLRLLCHEKKIDINKTTAIFSLTRESGELIITSQGNVKFSRDFKLTMPHDLNGPEAKEMIQTKLFSELRLSLEYFSRLEGTSEVKQIVTVTDALNKELCVQLQDDLSIPVQYIATAELTQGRGIGVDFVGALGIGLSGKVKDILDLNLCQGEGGNQPRQQSKNESFLIKVPPFWFPVFAGMGAAIVISLVFAGFEATIMLKKSAIDTLVQKLGSFAEVSIEEIKNKENAEKKKNVAVKSLVSHTDQAFLLTRLTSLLPKGIAFESVDLVFQETKAVEDRNAKSKKIDYTELESKRTLKIVAYAYLKNSNDEVRRINEFVSALKQDDFFSKVFQEIKLGALKVNSKKEHQVTTFMLECQ